MTIANLFARIGLQTDEAKAKSFDRSIRAVKIGMVGAAAGAVAFSVKLKQLTDQAFEAAIAFKQFEAETGGSAQELQKWQAVANQTNNSAEAVTASIKAIAANQEKIKLGQGNISGYQLLGISPASDPFEILEQLRIKTAGLSQAMKKNALQQMGVSSELIQVLELTNDEFDRMAANAFIVPPSAIDALDKARASGQMLGNAVRYIRQMIAANLSPAIDELNKKIALWIKQNQDGIIKTIQTIFGWINRFVTAMYRTATMIDKGVRSTIGWSNAIKILIGAIALLNSALLFSPIGAFIAAIAMLVLVMEDLYVYSKGGKSLFGRMMEQFPQLENALKGLWQMLKDIGAVLKTVFGGGDLGSIQGILDEWGLWGDIIEGIIEGLRKIREWFATAEYDAETGEFGNVPGYLKAQMADFMQLFTDPVGWAKEGIEAGKNVIGGLFGGGGGSATTNNVNVNINTSGNVDGESVQREMQRAFNSSNVQRGNTE